MDEYKLVLLGSSGAGKTSIVLRFTKDQYFDHQPSTIGAAFVCKKVSLPGKVIKFEIWDTAGQEQYSILAPMYYRKAAGVIVVYEVVSRRSFEKAKEWVKKVKEENGEGKTVIALAGNKSDLASRRVVSVDEAKSFASKEGLLFFQCSSKENVNISPMFKRIAERISEDMSIGDRGLPSSSGGGCGC
ncbi:Small GTPase like protein [Aduncisulcus paluster]|uniref:Small GTPase like protein n=1 Tax=Aduncisulcus paluster TaxID=2918883 RepID=A0ABQ5K3Q0_9EUKA|nr:Small GTPase like protein [Aduncisulcus paluster]|eukprot:gnl/Carplike_NY0171/5146_a7022_315.p1 GENE.gnl/Carplike_NY0171/5146_a7022_315~~gnl/Carplike_NY0171/5146_a7022_315.p1  ORF type:complete len:187 (+),score=41.86 gnl/Carplike_NY0171/5146_a7022_315:6-566(+)